MATARFRTRWMVLLISIFLLSACGGDTTTTTTSLTSEGTITVPFSTLLPVNTATPFSGQVGNKAAGKSYYTTASVTPNTTYTITLYGLSADADLEVYNDRPFTYILGPECVSQNGSTVVERCTVTTNSTTTTMYIAVDGSDTLSGATYTISVNGPRSAGLCDYAGTDVTCFNFESGVIDTTKIILTETGGGALWNIGNISATTGSYSILSGPLSNAQTSCFSNTPTTATSYVSFNLKTDSEKYFGLLLFYIDDVLQPPVWSGNMPSWQRVTFNTVSGTHTYKWCHTKNSTNGAPDDVWVDDINIK